MDIDGTPAGNRLASALAPIALFVYRRPEHTRRVLQSLAANPELASSELWVFCEGARGPAEAAEVASVRALVRSRAWSAHMRVIERPHNLGCAASILDGIATVLKEHERIIVLEDDLEVSPAFLAYMNEALDRYADEPRVMQVAGYMFPVRLTGRTDAFFLPFTNAWGWATWRRAWNVMDRGQANVRWLMASRWRQHRFDLWGRYAYTDMLWQAIRGEVDAWDIYWYLAVFRQNGLTLFPRRSLVSNTGFTGGTHPGDTRLDTHLTPGFHVQRYPQRVAVLVRDLMSVRALFRRPGPKAIPARCAAWLRRLVGKLDASRRPT